MRASQRPVATGDVGGLAGMDETSGDHGDWQTFLAHA